jgi:hypothetical protein
MVRGAHASRVLHSASRRVQFGGLGRDAQADTRDACAPRTLDPGIGCCNASGLSPKIFTHAKALSTQRTPIQFIFASLRE